MIKDFWEIAHRNNKLENLTGTTASDEVQLLHIKTMMLKSPILVIGVGCGFSCQHYKKLDYICDALDISDIALEKVKKYTVNNYNSPALLPENRYNLIQSWLVSQHINNQDFDEQTKHVIKSLTPQGVYALQFIYWFQIFYSYCFQKFIYTF